MTCCRPRSTRFAPLRALAQAVAQAVGRAFAQAGRCLAGLLLGAAAATSTAAAQAVAGVGDDAIPVNKGMVRVRVAGLWNDWDAVFDDRGGSVRRRGLLASVSADPLGVAALPQLSGAETAIRTLSGSPAFALSLGTLEARGDVRQSSAPIQVDVGVTRRVSIGLLVPYVESRDNAQLLLNRTGDGANVGVNPAFTTAQRAAARAANGQVLRQLAQARAQLTAEIARCTDLDATGCDAIRADLAGAQQLLARANATQGAVAGLYGDSLGGGSPLVPFSGTALGQSIEAGLGALRTAFAGFGVATITANALPAGAVAAYGPGAIGTLVSDSVLGLAYRRLGNTRRAGIGDIDLTATLLLFDTFGGDQRLRLANRGRALRSTASLGWRFGTAGADDPLDPFDVPIGDGANAVLARSTTDVVFNRRTWVSGTVRIVKPLADDRAVALPFRGDSALFVPFVVGSARRTLGTRIDVELAPRLALGDFFGVSAAYLFRRVGADGLRALGDGGENAIPTIATSGPVTMQAASAGVSFSSLASYVRGRSRFPVELTYTHTRFLTASGGVVPAVSTDRLELRIYTGFPRR